MEPHGRSQRKLSKNEKALLLTPGILEVVLFVIAFMLSGVVQKMEQNSYDKLYLSARVGYGRLAAGLKERAEKVNESAPNVNEAVSFAPVLTGISPETYVRGQMREKDSFVLIGAKADDAVSAGLYTTYNQGPGIFDDTAFFTDAGADFYTHPAEAAAQNPWAEDMSVWGYWSAGPNGSLVYTLPLINELRDVYGVYGAVLTADELTALLSNPDAAFEDSYTALMTPKDGQNSFQNGLFAAPGAAPEPDSVVTFGPFEVTPGYTVYRFQSGGAEPLLGVVSELDLYGAGSLYSADRWRLVSAANEQAVRNDAKRLSAAVMGCVVLSAFLSLIPAFVFLKRRRGKAAPEAPSITAIYMQRIMDMVNVSMGTFEVNHQTGLVTLSDSFFDLTRIPRETDGSAVISSAAWENFLASLGPPVKTSKADGFKATVYAVGDEHNRNAVKWFELRQVSEQSEHGHHTFGVLMDITEDNMEKQRLEYERNYDPLTRLLNRQAFLSKAAEAAQKNPQAVGVMMFADLDNLKHMNDTYGHAFGDRYLQAFSSHLMDFREYGAIVGRNSGDEFVAYLHGYADKHEARKAFEDLFNLLLNAQITAPDGQQFRLQASVGLSYYPGDSGHMDELMKYADYAMYEVKRSLKGVVNEFQKSVYARTENMSYHSDIFNLFVEEERVQLAFQPIVDVRTGDVFAYEALMRPMMRELKTPAQVLQIAKYNSQLYIIEKMMYRLIFRWLGENLQHFQGKRLFINSVPNQVFLSSDMQELEREYSHLFKYIVLEITESEQTTEEILSKKVSFMRAFGGRIAIDNYGTAYQNDSVFMSINPDYIKIDMELVREIHKDRDRQQIVQNIVSYALKRNIEVIAEGVETEDEFRALARYGIRYAQGYFLARPKFELLEVEQKAKNAIKAMRQEAEPSDR